jgi:hypothetical protein
MNLSSRLARVVLKMDLIYHHKLMKITTRTVKSLAMIGGLALMAAPLSRANLIVNGGFETGNFSGWTVSGNTGATGVGNDYSTPYGNYSADLGAVTNLDYLSQSFATTVGDVYQVSFAYYGLYDSPTQEFDALFGASQTLPTESALSTYFGLTDLLSLGGPHAPTPGSFLGEVPGPTDAWVSYTYDVTAGTTDSMLLFASRQDPSYDALDNVSVVDLGPSGPSVPDAANSIEILAMALVGMGIYAFGLRRRIAAVA